MEVAPIPLRGYLPQAAQSIWQTNRRPSRRQVLAQGFALRMGQEPLQCSSAAFRLLGIDCTR